MAEQAVDAVAPDLGTDQLVTHGPRVYPADPVPYRSIPFSIGRRSSKLRANDWVEIKSLAPDRTGSLMTFGGVVPTGSGSIDVTHLDYAQIEHLVETCEVSTDDLDGDGLAGCTDPDCRSRCAPLCATNTAFADCTGPHCGDGVCSSLEDYLLCPSDCPVKP